MLKFAVIIYKRPEMSVERFREYFRAVHGPLAEQMPGLRRYVQNFVVVDPKREPPGWDGIAELYFGDREAMEAAWASPEGERATNDLANFADLKRTTWSVVDEFVIRPS